MKFLALSALVLLNTPSTALAYLDPGTGSYMIQVAVGLIAGAVFMIKNYWVVISGYFRKLFKKDK
jgi:hypothetical protein